jgi:two-component system sensor histidine kinase/response regulator
LLRVATALKLSRLGTERDELYALLRHQRDDLLRLSLQRERLSAFLVHDLKNPAYGIKLAAELLLADGGSSPRTQEVAQRIRQESGKLMSMTQNLLDIAKADEQRLVLSCAEIELGLLLEEICSALSLQAKARDIELQVEVQARLSADREILRRLLENLLDNALRHAPRGSVVSVEAARRDRGLELRVRDRGPGVPPELRESIFERFVQGGEPKGRLSYGLGLTFCKLAVEAHGGKIWIEDGDPGTVFCVWWSDLTPCEPTAPRAPARLSRAPVRRRSRVRPRPRRSVAGTEERSRGTPRSGAPPSEGRAAPARRARGQ